MNVQPAVQGAAIVLNGGFAPQTFSPEWLRRVGVIDDGEFAGVTAAVTPQVTQLDVDVYQMQIVAQQFSIQSVQEPFIRISDVVVKLFRDLLPYTPLTQMGVNLSVHFDAGSRKRRDRIGNSLAPVTAWGEWGTHLNSDNPAEQGGLLHLIVQRNYPERDGAGYQQVHVQPSIRPFASGGGVYVLVNNHFQLGDIDPTQLAASILEENFDRSMAEARALIDQIDALGAEP